MSQGTSPGISSHLSLSWHRDRRHREGLSSPWSPKRKQALTRLRVGCDRQLGLPPATKRSHVRSLWARRWATPEPVIPVAQLLSRTTRRVAARCRADACGAIGGASRRRRFGNNARSNPRGSTRSVRATRALQFVAM